MTESEVPDPAVYGTAWRRMSEAPLDGGRLLMLLVPNRPEIKVVKGVRAGHCWLLDDASILPEDQPPIGWMYDTERSNWHPEAPTGPAAAGDPTGSGRSS